jgi:hydrogenase expression/formation protein HypE
MQNSILPLGKLPVELLQRLLERWPVHDPRVLNGPGIGIDCAVVDAGDKLMVFKTDPITFATDEIGWYAVQINSNDLATTGAAPRWFLATLLLPEGKTTPALVDQIGEQIYQACQELGIAVIGGHTEVTYGLERPILVGTLVGEVERQRLVVPRNAAVGDRLLLTKGVPIEATAILAREFPQRLQSVLSAAELRQAADYLYRPGISVLKDAQIALAAGRVTAMHDPTEGGLAAALWELADASGKRIVFWPQAVHIPPLAGRVCAAFGLDPLSTIASGALLLTSPAEDAGAIRQALEAAGIRCTEIGRVEEGPAGVWHEVNGHLRTYPRPERDSIAAVFERP